MCPPYPQLAACRKERLNWAVSRNNHIKRLDPCRCLDGHVKEPYEMSMALGALPQAQILFYVPSHITEISLNLTLSKQSHSHSLECDIIQKNRYYYVFRVPISNCPLAVKTRKSRSSRGPPPGLCPRPTGGLRAAPDPLPLGPPPPWWKKLDPRLRILNLRISLACWNW